MLQLAREGFKNNSQKRMAGQLEMLSLYQQKRIFPQRRWWRKARREENIQGR
jgi:hypothetical protein